MPAKKKITEKADKRRRAKVTVGHDADGAPIVKYASGKTVRELEESKNEIKKMYIGGARVDREILFDKYVIDWFKTYKLGKFSAGSDENYNSAINRHLVPAFGGRQLRSITAIDLQQFMNSKNGLGAATLGYINGILQNTFAKACAHGIIDRNPALGLIKPPTKRNSRRALTEEERAASISVGSVHSRGLLILLLYYTGMRRGEALGIQWRDIDFTNKTISVQRDVDYKTGKIGSLKSVSAYRYIPIPDALLLALEENRGIGEAFVLQGEISGSFICLSTYKAIWRSLMKEIYASDQTIENDGEQSILTAHYYRHNYASMLHDAGIDILLAQKWLGHADVKTTLSIYTHLSKSKERADSQLIQRVF